MGQQMTPRKRWLPAVLFLAAILVAGVLAPVLHADDPIVHVMYFYSPT
jgi:hypothetical protein